MEVEAVGAASRCRQHCQSCWHLQCLARLVEVAAEKTYQVHPSPQEEYAWFVGRSETISFSTPSHQRDCSHGCLDRPARHTAALRVVLRDAV